MATETQHQLYAAQRILSGDDIKIVTIGLSNGESHRGEYLTVGGDGFANLFTAVPHAATRRVSMKINEIVSIAIDDPEVVPPRQKEIVCDKITSSFAGDPKEGERIFEVVLEAYSPFIRRDHWEHIASKKLIDLGLISAPEQQAA